MNLGQNKKDIDEKGYEEKKGKTETFLNIPAAEFKKWHIDFCKLVYDGKVTDAKVLKKTSKSESGTIFGIININNRRINSVFKISLDIKPYPNMSKYFIDRLQANQGLKYESMVYKYIYSTVKQKNLSPNFIQFIAVARCSAPHFVNRLLKSNENWKKLATQVYTDKETLHDVGTELERKAMAVYQKYELLFGGRDRPSHIRVPQELIAGPPPPQYKVDVLITENASNYGQPIGTFYHFLKDKDIPMSEKTNVLFQLMHAIYVMNCIQLVHHDMHLDNILMVRIPKRRMLFVIDNKKFLVETEYLPLIFDWDRSYCEKLGDNFFIDGRMCDEVGICNYYEENYDLYLLLCHLALGRTDLAQYAKSTPYYSELMIATEKEAVYPVTPEEVKRIVSLFPQGQTLFKIGRYQLLNMVPSLYRYKIFPHIRQFAFYLIEHKDKYYIQLHRRYPCRPMNLDDRYPTAKELLVSSKYNSYFSHLETKQSAHELKIPDKYVYQGAEDAVKKVRRIPRVDPEASTRYKIKGQQPRFPFKHRSPKVKVRK